MTERRWKWGAATGLAIAAGAALYATTPFDNAAPDSLPSIDLSAAHPQVVNVVTDARAGVCTHPRSAAHWGHLAMVLMAHQWAEEARHCLHEAHRRAPDDFRWKYLEAVLLEETDLAAADETYEAVVRLKPDYPPARYRWGRILMRLDRLEQAADQFRRVAELSPESPEPHIELGRIALLADQIEEAREHLERAVAVSPWNKSAHWELARVHHRLGDMEAARREQETAARLPNVASQLADPVLNKVENREVTRRQLAEEADTLAARGHLREAEAAYRQLMRARPELSRPRLNLANLLARQSRFEEAITLVCETIDASPGESLAQYQLGLLYESTGRRKEAIEAFRAAVATKPDYAQAHFALGLQLEAAGQEEAACNAYQRAIDADPQLAQAHLALGVLLEKSGNFQRGVHHMESAVRLAPADPIPRQYLEAALKRRSEGQPAEDP